MGRPVAIFRSRRQRHHVEVVEERKPPVDTEHGVLPSAALPVGGDRADVRSAEDLLAHACHREVLAGLAIGVRGLGVQHADIEAGDLAGELAADRDGDRRALVRQADVAAVEQLERRRPEVEQAHAHAQRVGAFDEELALLGKEQAEARQVDLLRVHFGLREVGVHREVGGQRRGRLPLQVVDADLGDAPGRPRRRDRIERLGAAEEVRAQAHAFGLLDVGEAAQVTGLRDVLEPVVPAPAGPIGHLVAALDHPLEVQPPRLRRGAGEAQDLEGDGDLHRPAGVGEHRGGGPLLVPVGVVEARFVAHQRVEARAARVDAEDEGVAVVVIGVEQHREGVVAVERVVAPQLRRADVGGHAVVEHGADVEIRLIVGNANGGALARVAALVWLTLLEAGDDRRLLPDRIVQAAVELGWRGDLQRHGRRGLRRLRRCE